MVNIQPSIHFLDEFGLSYAAALTNKVVPLPSLLYLSLPIRAIIRPWLSTFPAKMFRAMCSILCPPQRRTFMATKRMITRAITRKLIKGLPTPFTNKGEFLWLRVNSSFIRTFSGTKHALITSVIFKNLPTISTHNRQFMASSSPPGLEIATMRTIFYRTVFDTGNVANNKFFSAMSTNCPFAITAYSLP